MIPYYADKAAELGRLFGVPVVVKDDAIAVGGRLYPVVDDVIIALDASKVRGAAEGPPDRRQRDESTPSFAADVQASFGAEWTAFPDLLHEHAEEFSQYFDLVNLETLDNSCVLDLGCGIGRWAYFLAERAQAIVLVDYSEAIFVARRNLKSADNAIFVMADLLDLPFADNCADFAYTLGVLHHLPVNALDALRGLRRLAPRHLGYLYYALDNRPRYFRLLLGGVTHARRYLSKRISSARGRSIITFVIAAAVYEPLVGLGRMLTPLGGQRFVPLAEGYAGWSLARIRQDVYDRFFTSIEQRFTRRDIQGLDDTFATVVISDAIPYWHFLCINDDSAGGDQIVG